MADSQGNDNSTCVVCFKNVLYYSIGECDHPVCFECSTRMRVLCLQNECPICRQDLARVVFTETVLPYKELRNKVFNDRLFERQFKIGFCTQEIKNAYDKLLENHCKLCEKIPPFRTFAMLSDHMRRVHERFFCDLCVKHLRIFTSERKCYTRQELAHHRRKGDLDDTSHRGHPLCEFCEERFMDADELYRHLRKEHLYCHLCDADGRNLYYATHSALAHHFRTDHFLCEEGECAEQHLTSVFRSEIDLKAHKATVHGRGMNRGAARQARTLELQFNITPHPVAHRAPHRNNEPRAEPQSPPPMVQSPRIDTHSVEQFPRLSAAQPQPSLTLGPVKHYNAADGLTRNERNFPALDGAGATAAPPRPRPGSQPVAAVLSNSKPSVSIQLHSQPASASNFRLTQTSGNRISIPQHQKRTPLNDDDFPSLGRDDHPSIGAGTVQPPKVTMINSQEMNALKSKPSSQAKKPQHSGEAFPALAGGAAPAAPPQWITVSKGAKPGKAKEKPNKPDPPPQPSFNPVADFPTLPVNAKPLTNSKPKKSPAPQPAVIQTNSKPSKKDKKKQNNNAAKKENVNDFALLDEFAHVNGAIDKKIAREMSYVGISVNNNASTDTQKKVKTVDTTAAASEGNQNGGHGDFSLAARDYPPLSARVQPKEPTWPAKKDKVKEKVPNGAPPGFKARPPCNGMTFTNSSGQTFSAPLHAYVPPPDFEQRNRELVKKFAVALGGAAAVEDFKGASRAFRDGLINADEFYSVCQAALGPQLETVFPELVALLPDIGKQQELVASRAAGALRPCDACGQLLAPRDEAAHNAAHWPPL